MPLLFPTMEDLLVSLLSKFTTFAIKWLSIKWLFHWNICECSSSLHLETNNIASHDSNPNSICFWSLFFWDISWFCLKLIKGMKYWQFSIWPRLEWYLTLNVLQVMKHIHPELIIIFKERLRTMLKFLELVLLFIIPGMLFVSKEHYSTSKTQFLTLEPGSCDTEPRLLPIKK